MLLKNFFPSMMLFFLCCANKEGIENNNKAKLTNLSSLSLSYYLEEGKKWDIKCFKAQINESQKILNCKKPFIVSMGQLGPLSQIEGEFGFLDLNNNNAFIKDKVKVISLREKMTLYSSKIYFDFSKQRIWSDSTVKVITDKTETSAAGFTASHDLSKIELYKHETKKI